MRAPSGRPVVLTCDATYQPAAIVCLTSAFLNSPDVEFTSYVVTNAPSARLTHAVGRLAATFGRDVRVAAVDAPLFRQFTRSFGPLRGPAYISSAALMRLAVPELLPVVSFLYLDCDLVVQDSLATLLRLDVGDALIGAASDGLHAAASRHHLGLPPDEPYVNSGVLVVNARAWREAGGITGIARICAQHRGRLGAADQDIVNLFCLGRKHLLDRRWNTLQSDYLFTDDWDSLDVDAFRGIFHFSSEMKPWMVWAPPKTRWLYGRYAGIAPWAMPEVTAPRNDQERALVVKLARRDRIRRGQRQS